MKELKVLKALKAISENSVSGGDLSENLATLGLANSNELMMSSNLMSSNLTV